MHASGWCGIRRRIKAYFHPLWFEIRGEAMTHFKQEMAIRSQCTKTVITAIKDQPDRPMIAPEICHKPYIRGFNEVFFSGPFP
jgi:hypothetical protein